MVSRDLQWLVCNYLKEQFGKTMKKFLNTICSAEKYQATSTKHAIPVQNHRQSLQFSHLNEMGDSCWGLKDDPLIDSNSFLVIILLDGNISSKEQETVWGDFCAVIQVYL